MKNYASLGFPWGHAK